MASDPASAHCKRVYRAKRSHMALRAIESPRSKLEEGASKHFQSGIGSSFRLCFPRSFDTRSLHTPLPGRAAALTPSGSRKEKSFIESTSPQDRQYRTETGRPDHVPFRLVIPSILFLTSIFFLNFISRIIWAPLMPAIEGDLGIGHGEAGSFFFSFPWGTSLRFWVRDFYPRG
jgi:hypothetical protein